MMSDGNQAYEMTDDCFISMIADKYDGQQVVDGHDFERLMVSMTEGQTDGKFAILKLLLSCTSIQSCVITV